MAHNKSSNKQNWRTPKWLFEAMQKELLMKFTIDAAADEHNHLCKDYFSKKDSFLEYKGMLDLVWCNPPFDRKEEFIDKFIDEYYKGAMLLPSDTGAKWFKKAFDACEYMYLLTGRVSFLDTNNEAISGNPAPSVVFVFNGSPGHNMRKVRFLKTQQLKKENKLV